MNKFIGKIHTIKNEESINLVEIDIGGFIINAVTLQLNRSFEPGHNVTAICKETEVALHITDHKLIGIENYIPVTIREIKKGRIFTEIGLSSPIGEFRSIATNLSITETNLDVKDKLFALIKATEISLGEIDND